jgi:spore coat protein U-like protein
MPIKSSFVPRFQVAAFSLLGAFALCPNAFAATAPSTIGVSATVQATCLNTATSLAFGTYSGAQDDATAIITITCTNTTPYTVGIDAGLGTGPAATVTTRHMNGPAAAGLAYTLKSVSQTGANWGVTVGTDTVSGTATGAAQPMTVYGRTPAGQFVTPGVYTDTVTATVTY